jgi:polysaccharide export outer membrane protein
MMSALRTPQSSRRATLCALGAAFLLSSVAACNPFRRSAEAEPVAPVAAYDLGTGELRTGDRIVLRVEDEEALTDTFTVRAGPAIDLPVIGAVELTGVKREAVQAHLTTEIGKYIKNPSVRATTLVRVAVMGEVVRAGFFALPADALVSDVINEAGGPTPTADMKKIQLSRRGKVVQEGSRLRNSIAAGRTLNEMGMQAGDEIIIPERRDSERTWRIIGIIVTIPLAIFAITSQM